MSDECMPEEAVTNFGKQIPMKRPGQPAELATAYVMLADPLSSYAAYYEQGHDAFDSSRRHGSGPGYGDSRHAQISDRVVTCALRDRPRRSRVRARTHLQRDVLGRERDPLDMTLNQVAITVRDWLELGAARL
jgi:hypothetical protein